MCRRKHPREKQENPKIETSIGTGKSLKSSGHPSSTGKTCDGKIHPEDKPNVIPENPGPRLQVPIAEIMLRHYFFRTQMIRTHITK
jgi:hypothetical protein